MVTNLNTGGADYLPVPRRDREATVLQASCAMPLLFPTFEIDGQPYLDGGIGDAIPGSGRWTSATGWWWCSPGPEATAVSRTA